MVIRLRITWLVALLISASASGQTQYQYTDQVQGPTHFALGYPVPVPIDSVTAVDGFRSYEALHMRHQDLMLQNASMSGSVVGQTHADRDIWAYVLGDPDAVTVYGTAESAVLINANIHAREWQTAETSTAIIETLMAHQDDQYLHQYLLENVNWVIVPVLNVDGLLQTQRYYDTVLVGQDPTASNWPRDGRMRRKNMPNVDEVLSTTADHLGGIDLNRNFPPYWASTNSSSTNPNSLVYHGVAALSEPESLALIAASELGPVDQLRWYEDIHSFGMVVFSKRTSIFRRNALQARLLTTFRVHHSALSAAQGWFRNYTDLPDPVDVGIGVTPDYFAATYQIPAWTLEIEPTGAGGLEYNGFGTEHDGFILPESQIDRVRSDLAASHMIMAYQQAGPPAVTSVKITDQLLDVVVFGGDWVLQADGTRQFVQTASAPLVKGRKYDFWIAFDKPMRWRTNGEVSNLPGVPIALVPQVTLLNAQVNRTLPTDNGQWLDQPGGAPDGFHHYRDDAFTFSYRVPSGLPVNDGAALVMGIQAVDMVAQQTDTKPATVIDWQGGGWQNYEGDSGVNGDVGGTDISIFLTIGDELTDQVVLTADTALQEGSVQDLVVTRVGNGDGALSVDLNVSGSAELGSDIVVSPTSVSFNDGELGSAVVTLAVPDNLDVDDLRTFTVTQSLVSGAASLGSSSPITIVDNDASSQRNYNVVDGMLDADGSPLSMHDQLQAVVTASRFAAAPVTVELPENAVIKPDQALTSVASRSVYGTVRKSLMIRGNGATLQRDDASVPYRFFTVHGSGDLTLDNMSLINGSANGAIGGAISSKGTLIVDSVSMSGNDAGDGGAIWSRGELIVVDSTFHDNQANRGSAVFNGLKTVTATGVTATENTGNKGVFFVRSTLFLSDSVVSNNALSKAALTGVGEVILTGSTLSGNTPRNCRTIQVVDGGGNVDDDGTCVP